MQITIKCTYIDEVFYNQLIDLIEEYDFIEHIEGYDMTYTDTMKKGCAKVKAAFASKIDPFVGIWFDGNPIKGFYSEDGSCTIENIKNWLNEQRDNNKEA